MTSARIPRGYDGSAPIGRRTTSTGATSTRGSSAAGRGGVGGVRHRPRRAAAGRRDRAGQPSGRTPSTMSLAWSSTSARRSSASASVRSPSSTASSRWVVDVGDDGGDQVLTAHAVVLGHLGRGLAVLEGGPQVLDLDADGLGHGLEAGAAALQPPSGAGGVVGRGPRSSWSASSPGSVWAKAVVRPKPARPAPAMAAAATAARRGVS